MQRTGNLYFTKHAIERLEERLDMTPEEVLDGVSDMTLKMAFHGARKLKIPSKNASLVLNGDGFVVTAYALK